MKSLKSIGKTLRELRGDDSQEVMACKLGVSKSALAMYERGERMPRDEVKLRIANHFGQSVQSIFFDDKEHE